jgi:hypothetical protein
MSSGQAAFDLKAAREAMARATERPNVTTDIYHLAALTYLPAALDEIERLQADNQKWREYNLQLDRKNRKQRTALKKLGQVKRERGKVLVEERAQWNAICRDVGADPSDRYCTGEGEDGYPDAREQLRREGKL